MTEYPDIKVAKARKFCEFILKEFAVDLGSVFQSLRCQFDVLIESVYSNAILVPPDFFLFGEWAFDDKRAFVPINFDVFGMR